MDVFEAIEARRSLKAHQLRPDPVDRALLLRVLEAARWAPTHGLTEPWRFTVFDTPPARAALAAAIVETLRDPGEPPLDLADPRRRKVEDQLASTPVVLAIVCAPSDSPKIVEHEEIASVAMAVQNLHLAATALGLGGYWSSGKKAFHPRVSELLGLTGRQRCLGFFYLGWPIAGARAPGTRAPIAEKITWYAPE